MHTLRSLSLVVGGAGIAAAQQTLTVGPGQPFATIPAAIAAASPGDTVLVLAGTYTQVLDIDKGISLVGRGAVLQISTLPGLPAITVHDVPSGETFAMSGFDLVPAASGGTSLFVQLRDCAGPVALRGLQGNSGQRWSIASLRVPQLHLASSFLFGFRATDSHAVVEDCLTEPVAGAGVTVTDSTVVLVACTVRGGNSPVFGGPAANLVSGTLVATRTELRAVATAGYPAITTTAGAVLLDPSTTLVPTGAAPAISGPVAAIPAKVASLVAHTDGALLTVDSHGSAGALFATVISVGAPQAVTAIGLTWLDPASAVVFYFATYGLVDRRHSITIPHPTLPAGLVFAVQSVHFASGGPALGTPSFVTTP